MISRKTGRGRRGVAIVALLGLIGCGWLSISSAAAQSSGSGGMTIHIDPRTGQILREPAPGTTPMQLSPREREAGSTSHQGLTEVPGTEPGGGVRLDLRGRFRSPLVGTIDEKGNFRMQHVGE